jgi:hypothetical protein
VTAPGFYDGIPHAVYLADKDGPRLSHSLAHLMLSKSPRHAWAAHPLLGNLRVDDRTEERDRGTLLHSLLLGIGQSIEVLPFDNWRTKEARECRAAAEEAGTLPVLAPTYDAACETAGEIRGSLLDLGFVIGETGHFTEQVAAWEENGVACRARIDLRSKMQPGVIADLKIVRSANPATFGRTMLAYGLDVQHATYVSAVEHLIPELAGRVRMEFLLCEPFPPYAVCRVRPAGSMRSLGASKWARAVKLWGECLASGKWPGYGIAEVDAPTWALTEDLSTAVAEAGDPGWLEED